MSSAIVSRSQQIYSQTDISSLLSNTSLWLDFSDPTRYTLTNPVTLGTVTDKSPNPRSITVNGTVRFDSITKGIRLSGAGTDFLTVSGLPTPGTVAATAAETIFMVCYEYSGSSAAYIGGTTSATGTRYIRADNASTGYGRIGSSLVTNFLSGGFAKLYTVSFVLSNGVVTQYLNGNFNNSSAYTMTTTEATQTIGRAGASFPFRGGIYEVILFNTALSDGQRRALDYYLIDKWRVQTTTLTTPLSVSGCTLWLDGNDTSTLTYSSGTNVQQWSDKSGNNYHAIQNTGSQQPVYDTTLKGLKFTATSLSSMPTTAPFSRTETVFVVAGVSTTTGTLIGTNSVNRGRTFRLVNGANAIRLVSDSTNLVLGNNTNAAFDTSPSSRCVVSYINTVTSGFNDFHLNGLQDIAGTTALNYTAGSFLNIIGGCGTTGNAVNYDSYIYEVILFNSEITVQNRLDIIEYLMNKWGIIRFPITNVFPFYRSPHLRLFNPRDISNCLVWLDANDPTTITLSGSNVTQWNDKSGNNNHAIAGTTTYPVYSTNSVNGLASIQMRSINDYFLISTNNFTTASFPSLCYFIVLNISTSQTLVDGRGGILSTDTAGVFGRSLGITSAGNYEEEYYNGFVNLTAYTANVWQIASLQFSGTAAATFSLNGTTTAGIASGTGNNTTGLKIGSYVNLGTPPFSRQNANFDVAEILVYGTVIRNFERQLIEGYLAHKWKLINNLPTTHVYRMTIPTVAAFIPTNLDVNCTLWLDGGDGSTVQTSGGFVTQWNDKSPYGRHAVSIGTGPTYNGVTGSLTFTGSQNLRGAATQLHNASTGNWTVFAVYSLSNLSGVPVLFNYDSTPTRVAQFFRVNSGPNTMETIQFTNTGTPTFANTTAAVTLNTTLLSGAVNTAANLTVYLNGANSATSAHGTNITTANNFYTVGVYQELSATGVIGTYTGNYFSGNMNEIIVFGTDLTTVQRQIIEGYLSWKWKIQGSLPANHPYKNFPPF